MFNLNDIKIRSIETCNGSPEINKEAFEITFDNKKDSTYYLGDYYTYDLLNGNVWDENNSNNKAFWGFKYTTVYTKPKIWDVGSFKEDFIKFLSKTEDKEALVNGIKILAITSIPNSEIFKLLKNENLTNLYNTTMKSYETFDYDDSLKTILFLNFYSSSPIKKTIMELDKRLQSDEFKKDDKMERVLNQFNEIVNK